MDSASKNKAYFNKAAERFGHSVKSVGWFSRENQTQRFQLLAQHLTSLDQSILDVGCGLGDFYHYLKKEGYAQAYAGIDVASQMINLAKSAYPSATFTKADFLVDSLVKHDVVIACGTLNLAISNKYEYLEMAIEKLLGLAQNWMGFNLLTAFPNPKTDPNILQVYDKEIVRKISEKFVKRVKIYDHYLPYEITVVLNAQK